MPDIKSFPLPVRVILMLLCLFGAYLLLIMAGLIIAEVRSRRKHNQKLAQAEADSNRLLNQSWSQPTYSGLTTSREKKIARGERTKRKRQFTRQRLNEAAALRKYGSW